MPVRYLTIEQRESLQRQLSDRAAALRDEIAAALCGSGRPEAIGLANHLDEIDDEAVADLESSIEVAEIERDLRELRGAEKALERLHTPEYGVCTDCGADIPYSRLNAEPSATRCIACQTKAERSQAKSIASGL
jgi:RNA polymerase-binding protein DksA